MASRRPSESASRRRSLLARWYSGREGIATWATQSPLNGLWRWRTRFTHANAQPALAFYAWDENEQAYLAFALNVLTLRGELISDVCAFVVRSIEAEQEEDYQRWPDEPHDDRRLIGTFERFGLPKRIN